ncbi:DNA polymerase delta subunit 4 [Mytilus galloprovincialis]|uniref:DNA polymerase delta subunit 4 n=2 Tax=Mytilus galloprovincialis TaxID=29158 RepID=A0A8B6FL16_MYTGA|nr:DNA polymerase delta subunit 4 [Mytilus galloprovincialis]
MKMATRSFITNSFKSVKTPKGKDKKEPTNDGHPSTSKADVEDELKILRHFDVTLEFGPCSGITRMERWERADKHGLNPPVIVKEILDKHLDDEEYTECLWKDYQL